MKLTYVSIARERERGDGRVVVIMGTPISGHPGMGARIAVCPPNQPSKQHMEDEEEEQS